MEQLGNGLSEKGHNEDALSVEEARLSLLRRLGASEEDMLQTQANLAITHAQLGHLDKALSMERDVYSGRLKLQGEEHTKTLEAANNYAASLKDLRRFEEAKALLRKTMPLARRVLGNDHRITLVMRQTYAQTIYKDYGATLDDLHEAVTTLEEIEPIARRVLGGLHPTAVSIEYHLQNARATLRAREAPPSVNR